VVEAPVVKHLVAFVSGILFAAGVCLSGMVRPSKVLGFLDVRGDWDPSLALVMGSALAIHAIAWAVVRRMRGPLLGGSFPGPAGRTIDARLVAGAALFGVGWGLSGFCPGPALVSVISGAPAALVFVASMGAAMVAHQWLDQRAGRRDEGCVPSSTASTDP
jgi:uncharacterized membrane protein YedE/YeeE